MSLRTITPSEARRLLDSGAVLIDIRESDEHARENIPGARHLPLSKLDEADLTVHQGKPVIFHCKRLTRRGSRGSSLRPARRLLSKAGSTPGARRAFRS
jgi:rhodanese-related sulfurtransferase